MPGGSFELYPIWCVENKKRNCYTVSTNVFSVLLKMIIPKTRTISVTIAEYPILQA